MASGRAKKKCPEPRVLMRILKELQDQGDSYPTNLAGSSSVSYKLLRSCLEVLEKHGLVTVTKADDSHDIVRITKIGADVLAIYQTYFQKLLED